MMHAVRERGWHGVVAHFRSCGGVPAEKKYHSGDTREIAHMLGLLAARYRRIYAVGISLGGNALAKYLGEQGRAGQAAVPQPPSPRPSTFPPRPPHSNTACRACSTPAIF